MKVHSHAHRYMGKEGVGAGGECSPTRAKLKIISVKKMWDLKSILLLEAS